MVGVDEDVEKDCGLGGSACDNVFLPLLSNRNSCFLPSSLIGACTSTAIVDLSSTTINTMLKPWEDKDEGKLLSASPTVPNVALGELPWKPLSVDLHKSPQEVFAHYTNMSQPSINKSDWTNEEERRLIELVNDYEEHEWVTVADKLGTNRTPIECLRHYQQTLNNRLVNSGEWTRDEDNRLRQLTSNIGEGHWQAVANCIPGRTSMQCQNRWHKIVPFSTIPSTIDWTPVDERRLLLSVIAHGIDFADKNDASTTAPTEEVDRRKRTKWVSIAKFVAGK
jgi:hypothetical protein